MKTPTLPSLHELLAPLSQLLDTRRGIPPKTPAKLERVCRLCRRNRRGAAAVEFALVAPIFFALIFGMIELGRAIMVQQVITNGSREGARIAVLDGSSGADVLTSVNDYLESASVSGANVTVDPTDPSSAGFGQPVTVVVSIPFSQVSWLPSPIWLGGDTELTATTVMRRETVQ